LSDYDKKSVQSIVDYAGRLIGRTLAEVVDLPDSVSESKGKGKLGQLVEKYFFEIQPPNSHAPDFPEAGLELKTTGVVKGPKQPFLAKERLVLTNINFNTIHLESWESSTLLTKCKLMLLLFYLFDSEVLEIDRKFVLEPTLMNLLSLSANDLAQIVSDWNYIREKVASKGAHELSEGDTTYLKACRKGRGGVDERLASQPNTDVRAQTRAFSFPASFISRHLREGFPNEPSLLSAPGQTVEQATARKLTPYFGMRVAEISSDLGWASKSKKLHWELVTRMLTGTGSKPVELKKAQIQLRTITIDSKGVPTENFSFPAFDYLELAKEEWKNARFADDLERRYLLAVFEKDAAGVKRFKTAGYWTMPFGDRALAKDVWAITRARVVDGNYHLPKNKEHPVAYVNTHGKNARELVPTPQGGAETRRSFWLNKRYLAHVIDSQLSPG
jgi:DNA mismatch repair protein MutH